MPGPDATASAALDDAILHPCFVGWLDFEGDPVRVTTAPYDVVFSGSGDPELDGHTFSSISPDFVAVGEVHHKDQGSDTLACSLSGLIGPDTDLLNIIGDRSKWQGRDARLWAMLLDTTYNRIGNIWSYYTGTMLRVGVKGSVDGQIIDLQIENYVPNFSEASNRTYLDQASYDAGDLSAEAAIAIANGKNGNGLADIPAQGLNSSWYTPPF